ncbi:MAG: GHKL domain-containing protein [Roseburia sp.]|nr:GHKL domain-containing protein [Roseburia sp.]
MGLLFGNVVVLNYFSTFTVYSILLDLLITLLFWKICLQGTFLYYIMGFVLYYLGLFFRSYIAFYIFLHIDSGFISVIGADGSLPRKLCLLFSQVILLLYVIIILYNRSKFFYGKNKVIYLCYFVLPVVALMILTAMMDRLADLYLLAPQLGVQIISTMMGFLFMAALIIYLSFHASRKQEKEQEAANLNKLLEIQKESIERFISQEKKARKMKHDLEHSLYSIQYLLEQKKVEEAIEIFEQIITEMYGTSKSMTAAQNIVDMVISNVEMKYVSSGITIQKDISYVDDRIISLIDLCILLGNLADNAMEAARMSVEKSVKIIVKEEGSHLYIRFSNTFSETHSDVHGFSTGKEKAWEHGFGLHSIREIVNRNHGYMQPGVEEGVFYINIII